MIDILESGKSVEKAATTPKMAPEAPIIGDRKMSSGLAPSCEISTKFQRQFKAYAPIQLAK